MDISNEKKTSVSTIGSANPNTVERAKASNSAKIITITIGL